MDPSVDFEARRGTWSYPGAAKNLRYMGYPNPREWSPTDDDWQLPDNWQETILDGFRERLMKYRSFQVFMDICVRCGACADKCHFFIGSGDPKNMPVLRAELLRSIYRRDFTAFGKILGKLGRWPGAHRRRCSRSGTTTSTSAPSAAAARVFCPYGIDTADITMMARELMNLVGLNINWIVEPIANCHRTGNHLGIQPHTFKDNVEFLCDELEEATGIRIDAPINQKGAEVLFVIPSADYFADPGIYTFMGYLLLFEHIGLDYTLSRLRLRGRQLRPLHLPRHDQEAQLQDLPRGQAARRQVDHRRRVRPHVAGDAPVHGHHERSGRLPGGAEVARSPARVFENAASTKMVHICEFTADLIKHGKLKLDKSRNDKWRVTFHDSCNPARAMGLLEEPRYVLKQVCNHFFEMPENTIREQTFCCARRRRSRQRREHGDAAAGRAAAGQRAASTCATSTTSTC